jgi:hypothetical protein
MYHINLLAQVNKLAALTVYWPFTRVQQPTAEPRPHPSRLHTGLAKLANAATLHVQPSSASQSTQRRDPRDPCNW